MRPAFCIQTVHFEKSDAETARQLGQKLYGLLTRSIDTPLSCGSGIPVLSAVASLRVDSQVADSILLIPVLGKTAFNTSRAKIIQQLNEWKQQHPHVHVLLLPTSEVWLHAADELPFPILDVANVEAENWHQDVVQRTMLAAMQSLGFDDERPTLFLSHASSQSDADLVATNQLQAYAKQHSSEEFFFQQVRVLTGTSLSEKIDGATRGVFVVVRCDSYGSRHWCQRELLKAKRFGLPTLIVEELLAGEQRSSPYAGNTQTFVWSNDPAPIMLKAMVRWLQNIHFKTEGQRLIKTANLPTDTLVLSRAPELLDLAQGPLKQNEPQLVLHPDPELPVSERQILLLSQPRLHLVTPTTLYRKLLERKRGPVLEAPLEGVNVAVSLSTSPDANGDGGFTDEHIKDATIFIARVLVSAGATLAYGGDFRRDPNNYTTLLGEVVSRYNNTTASYKDYLHSYLAAPVDIEQAPVNIPLTIHRLHADSDLGATIPSGEFDGSHPAALYFCDMRRVMAEQTSARVIMAGQNRPRINEDGAGYGGPFSGVAEEAWRTLQAGKPLYVIGGFGGASGDVADLFEDKPTPPAMDDEQWLEHDFYRANVEAIRSDEYHRKLELPASMQQLAEQIRAFALPLMENDEASLNWNGLTRQENLTLFRSRDPLTLASLVYKGLANVSRRKLGDKLLIELTPGSITAGTELDAISVATIDNMPLGGAAAAIDQIISGRARIERAKGNALVSVGDAGIGADWLYLASLGPLGPVDQIRVQIRDAAASTASIATRHGLRRIGVVSFGGAIIDDTQQVVDAMLDGFSSLAGESTLVWFESNNRRFEELKTALSARSDIQLAIRPEKLVPEVTPDVSLQKQLIIQVTSDHENLNVTVLPPAGTGIAFSNRVPVGDADFVELTRGGGSTTRNSPAINEIQIRGKRISELLFDEHAAELIHRCQGSKYVVVHDVASAWIPYEMLAAESSEPPSTETGLCRRLAIDWAPVESLFARPAKVDKFKVLLVVNPTLDLPGAAQEGQEIQNILQLNKRVELTVLTGETATCENVIAALPETDVLHYAGHAFFNGPAEHESGLILHGPENLTIRELQNIKMPRIAIVNACEAGRVRSLLLEQEPAQSSSDGVTIVRTPPGTQAASFAGLFLRSGIEAYVGTFWRVSDEGANQFANQFYTQLASGQKLDAAITMARKTLFEANHPDWANYILYGEGDFRLVNIQSK